MIMRGLTRDLGSFCNADNLVHGHRRAEPSLVDKRALTPWNTLCEALVQEAENQDQDKWD